METNVIQKRIDRITHLLERLDEIPNELDKIHEALYHGFITSKKFFELVNTRSNLLIERHNKGKELRMIYRIIEEEQEL